MPVVPSYERTKIARLHFTFADDDVPVDPTGLQVAIYYGGEVKVAASTPTRISAGFYYHDISIGADWDLDYYAALWTGDIGGVDFKVADLFKVIKDVDEAEGDLPTGAYCTLSDVQRELRGIPHERLPNIEVDIITMIQEEEERVDALTSNHWKPVTERQYIDGTGTPKLVLPYRPITSVANCTIRVVPQTDFVRFARIAYINVVDDHGSEVRSPSSDSVVQDCDLMVDVMAGVLVIPERVQYLDVGAYPVWDYTFHEAQKNIYIQYTHGYPNAYRPSDISRMCALLTAKRVILEYGDSISAGASSVNLDGASRSYPGVPYGVRLDRMDADIALIAASRRSLGVN